VAEWEPRITLECGGCRRFFFFSFFSFTIARRPGNQIARVANYGERRSPPLPQPSFPFSSKLSRSKKRIKENRKKAAATAALQR
jgi:hypothetical protein